MGKKKKKHFLTTEHRNFIKKNKYWLIFALVLLVIFSLYIAGIIGQVFSFSRMLGSDEKLEFGIIKCIAFNFTVSKRGIALVMIMYVIAFITAIKKYKDKYSLDKEQDDRGFDIENSGTYGTDKLMKTDDARDFCEVDRLSRINGMIVGKIPSPDGKKEHDRIISISPDGKRYKYDAAGNLAVKKDENGNIVPVREKLKINGNRHCMVVGPSGSGKSFCYALPAIFQSIKSGESFVVTDPKGELYQETSNYAKEHGYVVKIFNLLNTSVSDSWNILNEVMDEDDIVIAVQQITNIIIVNTQDETAGAQPIFVDGPKNLLTAAILCVLQSTTWEGPRTFAGVYDLLAYDDETIGSFIDGLPRSNPGRKHWANYMDASQNLRGNIKTGLSTRIQIMSSDVIRTITSETDIDLLLPGKAKCAYYIIMDDMNSTYKFLSSLFFSCLFNRLVKYSRTTMSGKLPVSVNMIMDEFIAIGKLPDFDKKLAMVRSAGISCSIIFQTLAQLQAVYPDGLWETLIANCSTMLCLAVNDQTTAEYMSKRSGVATIATESTQVNRPLIDVLHIPDNVGHRYQLQKREVLSLTEVMRLSAEHKVLISISGANLMLADSFPYTDMIDPSTLIKVNIMDHVPEWRLHTQYETSRMQAFQSAPQPQQHPKKQKPKSNDEDMDEADDVVVDDDEGEAEFSDERNAAILQEF